MRRRTRWIRVRGVLAAGALAAGAGLAGAAGAVPVTLEDGSSFVTIDPAAPEQLTAWSLNGVSHVREQRILWRIGGGGEAGLDTLTLDRQVASDSDGDGFDDTLFVALLDPQERFSIELRWSLSGTPFGPITAGAGADLALQVTVTSTAAEPLELDLYQYTDVDLFGSPGDDSASFDGGAPLLALRVVDTTGLGVYDALWLHPPDAVEAALYDETLASLTDGTPTVLSGATTAGPGDVTATTFWRALLAPGQSFQLAQSQRLEVAPIPEPGVALLLAAGLAGLAGARRPRHDRRPAQEVRR